MTHTLGHARSQVLIYIQVFGDRYTLAHSFKTTLLFSSFFISSFAAEALMYIWFMLLFVTLGNFWYVCIYTSLYGNVLTSFIWNYVRIFSVSVHSYYYIQPMWTGQCEQSAHKRSKHYTFYSPLERTQQLETEDSSVLGFPLRMMGVPLKEEL